MTRIELSPPHLSGDERALVDEAFAQNWLSGLGPHVTAFEEEMCAKLGAGHACALSSGTAGLHALVQDGILPAYPLDAWGNPLDYTVHGFDYSIVSHGADGAPGGEGLATDLSSSDPGSGPDTT